MWERIYRMLVKEFIQVLRDPRMKALIFVMPVIQLIMFGYAVTTDVDHIKTAVCDLDKSPQSRALIERFTASGYFTVVDNTDRPERLSELLDRGQATIGIQINRGFAEDLKSGRQATIQTIVDGTDSNTGTVAMDYAQRITQEFSRARVVPGELDQLAPPQTEPIELRSRAWYNPDLKSRYFNVPGVIAVVVLLISLLLTAMAIVREREIGTMEQLMVTPIRSFELILGKTLPFVLISFIDVLVVTFLPAFLLSGFLYSIDNMPRFLQAVTHVVQARYFVEVLKNIFLKASPPAFVAGDLIFLGLFAVVVFAVALGKFRKKLA